MRESQMDFILSLSDNIQTDIIEAFNSTSRYLDDLLNIDKLYFEQMVGHIYPTKLQSVFNIVLSQISHADRCTIDMKHIKREFSLKALVRSPGWTKRMGRRPKLNFFRIW